LGQFLEYRQQVPASALALAHGQYYTCALLPLLSLLMMVVVEEAFYSMAWSPSSYAAGMQIHLTQELVLGLRQVVMGHGE
jgi:hypothetical protein